MTIERLLVSPLLPGLAAMTASALLLGQGQAVGSRAAAGGRFLRLERASCRMPAESAVPANSAVARAVERAATVFVANAGQWDGPCRFRARFGAMVCDVERDGWSVVVRGDGSKGAAGARLRFRFAGATDDLGPTGETTIAGRRNYFLGDDPSRWRTDVAGYRSVRFQQVAPGIDVVLRECESTLKYDVVAAANADIGSFRVLVEGATSLDLDADGGVVATTVGGTVRQPRPESFSGGRKVASNYSLDGTSAFGFVVRGWDRSRELVIDPGLVCSTYIGGTGSDNVTSIAKTTGPIVTLCGNTNGDDFPTTAGAFDRTYNGGVTGFYDAYVLQLDLSRSGPGQLVYGTYLGGPGHDGGSAVVVGPQGIITMVGSGQAGFPTTPNAYRRTPESTFDPCVVQLDPSRTGTAQLLYSTFTGGQGDDQPYDAILDAAGRVVFVGSFGSGNLPITPNAIRTAQSQGDGFVFCLDPSLPPAQQVVYCTFVGGNFLDEVRGVALGPNGTIVVGGYSDSEDLLTTPGAFQAQRSPGGAHDAFVWILDPTKRKAEQLVYGTFFGGFDHERTFGVDVDIDGTVTLVGNTLSLDFPTTPNAFSRTILPQNGSDGFITKLDPRRSGAAQLVYSTYFGGNSAGDGIVSIHSRHGLVTVMGGTYARDLPTTSGSFARSPVGALETFVAQLDTVRSRLLYSTFLGGSRDEGQFDMMVDENGDAIVVGSTASYDYPTTANAFDRTFGANGLADGVLTQLDLQATGLVRFGRGTRGCTGPVLLRGTAMPQMGNIGFGILCTNAPALSAGALFLSDHRLPTGVVVAGAELWIDPSAGLTLALSSSDLQRAEIPLPIPAEPDLIGGRVYAQAVWVGPSTPAPCPPLGLSTSFGLEITVQP